MKILIVLRNIDSYHNARFESLLNSNIDVSVFETRPKSREYLWKSNDNTKYTVYKFPNSLFPEKDLQTIILIPFTKNIFLN